MSYNTKLKTIIHDRGLKHGWIAYQAGIDPSLFSRYLSGTRKPTQEHQRALSKVLRVPIKELGFES